MKTEISNFLDNGWRLATIWDLEFLNTYIPPLISLFKKTWLLNLLKILLCGFMISLWGERVKQHAQTLINSPNSLYISFSFVLCILTLWTNANCWTNFGSSCLLFCSFFAPQKSTIKKSPCDGIFCLSCCATCPRTKKYNKQQPVIEYVFFFDSWRFIDQKKTFVIFFHKQWHLLFKWTIFWPEFYHLIQKSI